MTIAVKVLNADGRRSVAIGVLEQQVDRKEDPVSGKDFARLPRYIHVLHGGESQYFHVHSNQRLVVTEVTEVQECCESCSCGVAQLARAVAGSCQVAGSSPAPAPAAAPA